MTAWNWSNIHQEFVLLFLLTLFSPTVFVTFLLSDFVPTLHTFSTHLCLVSFYSFSRISKYFSEINFGFLCFFLLWIFGYGTFQLSDSFEILHSPSTCHYAGSLHFSLFRTFPTKTWKTYVFWHPWTLFFYAFRYVFVMLFARFSWNFTSTF